MTTVPRPWSAADLCTVAECAARMGIGDQRCIAWLQLRGLLCELDDGQDRGRRVIWGDVLEALRRGPQPEPSEVRTIRDLMELPHKPVVTRCHGGGLSLPGPEYCATVLMSGGGETLPTNPNRSQP